MWTEIKTGNYRISVKHYEEPSTFGIRNGRISKLQIRDLTTGEVVCQYERGWDIRPRDPEAKKVYAQIMKSYN